MEFVVTNFFPWLEKLLVIRLVYRRQRKPLSPTCQAWRAEEKRPWQPISHCFFRLTLPADRFHCSLFQKHFACAPPSEISLL
jgi:hypothetical protein